MNEAIEPTEREEIARVLTIPIFAGRSFGQPAIERIGGLTNRNYRITIGPDSYVLRLAGAGTAAYIDRRAEEHNAKVAAAAGEAEVLFFEAEAGTMLARYVDGARTMSESAFKDLARVERAARTFRQMHGFRSRSPGASTCSPRSTTTSRSCAAAAHSRGLRCPAQGGGRRAPRARRQSGAAGACHNDPLAENFIDSPARMYLVDWEYAGMNDPMWDLGDLSVEAGFGPEQDEALLAPISMAHRRPHSAAAWCWRRACATSSGRSGGCFR